VSVDHEEMVEGQRYKIHLTDCCIQGEVTGTFLGYEYDPEEPADFKVAALFDFGRLEPVGWGGWTPEHLP
jgi:hypothetical protein